MRRYRFDLTLAEPQPTPDVDLVIEVDTPEQMAALVADLLGHPGAVSSG